jgi:hypothetical protein
LTAVSGVSRQADVLPGVTAAKAFRSKRVSTSCWQKKKLLLDARIGPAERMNILRHLAAVVAGYLVFGLSAAALFQISGRQPHDAAPLGFMIGATAYGMSFAALGGYVAAKLAPEGPILHAGAVTMLIELGAFASLLARVGDSIWSQLAAVVLMGPCALAGGWLVKRSAR